MQLPRRYTNKAGFTLIELLVVVLIIGILAAIALPQYKKAVEKSRATQAITLLESVYEAEKIYYLANGSYALDFDVLSVHVPWTGTTGWYDTNNRIARSNGTWSLQISIANAGTSVSVGRLQGPYAGTGFFLYLDPQDELNRIKKDTLYCGECVGSACTHFAGSRGDYCQKIFKTSNRKYPGAIELFQMP
jgi:prepilin-type N-terminal cleavage/methylation domain-containing protein